MDSVHCFRCYRFPSPNLDFYVANCMHMFCVQCKHACEAYGTKEAPKCLECKVQPIRLLKMGPNMPPQVKNMFTPIREDYQNCVRDVQRVATFQARQRQSLASGMHKKMRVFEKLREAHNEEKAKKNQYKKQLDHAFRIIQSKEAELMDLKASMRSREATPTPPEKVMTSSETKSPAAAMVRVFSDSMYQTPSGKEKKKKTLQEIPPFLKSKSSTIQPAPKHQNHPPESFKTPCQPPKTSMGFTTPANPPHMFPHLKKLEIAQAKHHSSQ